MSILGGLAKGEFTVANDGLLELSEDKLRSIMRSEPITDVYHVESTPFARGKFASVRKIRHLISGEEYAAKFIRKRRRAADTTREIQHEVAVLALCSGCERVVRLHEVYETRSEVAIVLELCAGGELQRLLDEEERLSEGAARRALRHVLEGLAQLHARRVAHLDLKPQNLLLSADGDHLLICDFGISRAIQPGAHVREILGTRDYVAPEILSYEPLTLAADMWSVGVLAYVLLSGYSPFAGDTKQETYLNIAQCTLSFPEDLFTGVSDMAVQFIRETLVVDPKGRLTVEECLEHPWLKDEANIPATIAGVGLNNDLITTTETINTQNGHNGNQNGVNGTQNEHNETQNGINGKQNGVNGTQNGVNGTQNSDNATQNGVNGKHINVSPKVDLKNGIYPTKTVLNGLVNGNHKTTNGTNISSNCTNENGKGVSECNGSSSNHQDKVPSLPEECVVVSCHVHGHRCPSSAPFPDAPSTPKVLRKSHPPSVLALCKKFQPDLEARRGPPLRPPLPPDRTLIC